MQWPEHLVVVGAGSECQYILHACSKAYNILCACTALNRCLPLRTERSQILSLLVGEGSLQANWQDGKEGTTPAACVSPSYHGSFAAAPGCW
jgi:hypothetical protein